MFKAIQFHLHHRSEHHINGQSFDLELHVVHQARDKSLAVYGVLFHAEEGDFADPFDDWNLDTKVPIIQPLPIDLSTPLKAFHYKGSLTTPDCTEGVNWFVNTIPIYIKKSSLEKVAELINEGHLNNRDIQDLNRRGITTAGNVCEHRRGGDRGDRRRGNGGYHHFLRIAE